jgi:hypothetical protein
MYFKLLSQEKNIIFKIPFFSMLKYDAMKCALVGKGIQEIESLMIHLFVLTICSEIIWDPNETKGVLHSCLIQGVPRSSKTLAANIFRSYYSRLCFEQQNSFSFYGESILCTRTSSARNLETSFIFHRIHSLFSQEQNSFLLLDEIANVNLSSDRPVKVLNHVMDKTPSSVIHDDTNNLPFRVFIAATSNYDPEFSI